MTLSKIKVIYCYLICFVMIIFITVGGSCLVDNYLRTTYLEETYLPSDEVKKQKNQEKAVEEEKRRIKHELHEKIIWDITFLFWSLLTLGIHVVIIKRTKE